MKEDMIETEQRLKNNIDELVALSDDLGDDISKLDDRVKKIEGVLSAEDTKKRIPRQSDGSAKVFRLDTLGEYADQLPYANQCNELGKVLEK